MMAPSICPSCQSSNQTVIQEHLNNFYCNHNLNNIGCCFDSGDCFQDRFQCPSCEEDLSWFRDAICDEGLDNLECCYDGGDCPCATCPWQTRFSTSFDSKYAGLGWYSIEVGNSQCDRMLDTPECCFDGFDCRSKESRYHSK